MGIEHGKKENVTNTVHSHWSLEHSIQAAQHIDVELQQFVGIWLNFYWIFLMTIALKSSFIIKWASVLTLD